MSYRAKTPEGLKPKDLIGIPWRLAFALQKSGWYLRSEIIWEKPNCMPGSVKDRPTRCHEYLFLFSKSQTYFYDYLSVQEANGRNRRTVWSIPTEPFTGAHFATFPPKLVEPCILAGSEPELTLGPQLRGGALNVLGSKATKKVFDLISSLLSSVEIKETEKSIEVRNAAGRIERVEFANDPDICIREKLPSGRYRNLVAIEIKGGRDYSNVHNRIGEAEKSHQKARKEGYVECWTIVGVTDLDLPQARKESPSTDKFYHIDKIANTVSDEGEDFRENLLARIGINA
jgi:hypothetical protein